MIEIIKYNKFSCIRTEEARKLIHEVIQGIHEAAQCITFEDISGKEEKTGDHIK